MSRVLSDSDNDQTALYQDVNDRAAERAVTPLTPRDEPAFSAFGRCRF